MAKQIDRRVRKTTAAIKHAMVQLIAEKGHEDITVGDILKRADVGRSTFYAHFADKDDVLSGGFDDLMGWLIVTTREKATTGQRFGFSLALLQHVAEMRPFSSTVLAGKSGQMYRRFYAMVAALVREDLAALPDPPAPKVPLEAHVQSLTGAYMAIAGWWLEADCPCTAQDVDAVFRRLALSSGR